MNNKVNSMTRRRFLKIAALGAIGIHCSSNTVVTASPHQADENNLDSLAETAPTPKSRVVKVIARGVMDTVQPDAVRPRRIERMVEGALVAFTGKKDITEAWRSIVLPSDIVGIKINPIGGRKLSTNPEVVSAIIKGLMLTGVKENNIIVWDKEEKYLLDAGYSINTSKEGPPHLNPLPSGERAGVRGCSSVRCYATEPTAGYDKDVFYETDEDEPELRQEDGIKSLFSNIVTKHVTAIINVPVMKDHAITGVTLCLKNITFGSVNNAPRFHPEPFYGDPMMAEVYSHPMLKGKVRLHVLDALQACFAGGPANMSPRTTWNEEALFIGTDPVAIDQIGLEIIDQKRVENKFASIAQRARHIQGAAQMGLGTNLKNEMELIELDV